MSKTCTLDQILTPQEIEKAARLYLDLWGSGESHTFGELCRKEFIEPNLARINTALGQENETTYLSYVVEFVLSKILAQKLHAMGSTP